MTGEAYWVRDNCRVGDGRPPVGVDHVDRAVVRLEERRIGELAGCGFQVQPAAPGVSPRMLFIRVSG